MGVKFRLWQLRKEQRLGAFENRVLREVFGPQGNEIIEDWRNFHNEELHNFYLSSGVIRMTKSGRIRWVGHIADMGDKKNAYRFFLVKPKGNKLLERYRCRWDDNIKWILEN